MGRDVCNVGQRHGTKQAYNFIRRAGFFHLFLYDVHE